MAGGHEIKLINGSNLRVAPGVTIPAGEITVQALDNGGHPIPYATLECQIAYGSGVFRDQLSGEPKTVVRGTADFHGEWSIPQFEMGPEAVPNRLIVQSLHAFLHIDIVGTWGNVRFRIIQPAQGTEKLASSEFNIEAIVEDTGFHNAGVPNFPVEIEVVDGQGTVSGGNGAHGPVVFRRSALDGRIRFDLVSGWREENLNLRFTPYWNRVVPTATLALRLKAPDLLTYRTSAAIPDSPTGSLPVPFRNCVSRTGALFTALNADAGLQGRFAVSRTEGPVELRPKFSCQYIPEWSWFLEPTGPGTIKAHLRLPDHPETAELSEEWTIKQSPCDGPPKIVSGPGGAGIYVQTTGGGDRDQDSMIEANLEGPLIQFVGPNNTAPERIVIRHRFLPPPASNPTRRVIEARFRFKVRVSPFNSAADSPAHPTVIPGTIAPTSGGGWSDEFTVTVSPQGTSTRPVCYFKSPPQNYDHHVEITADVTLEELDATGTLIRRDQATTLVLRVAYMRPRFNFVRKQGPDWVPILEESIRPAVLQDASGAAIVPKPEDEFRLELIGQDLGDAITATIHAGEQVRGVELKKIEANQTLARYRSGPCYLYVHEITSGEPRPTPPPDVTYVWAGHVTLISASITDGMPGNTANPLVEYKTGNRPITMLNLVENGDAQGELKVPAPVIALRIPDNTELPVTVSSGQILVTFTGDVYDSLADLGHPPPTAVEIGNQSYPLTSQPEAQTALRPHAWKGTFSADVPLILGANHVRLRVTNVAGQIAERNVRVHVTELNNQRMQPQSIRAKAWPFVPQELPPVPVLRYVYASCNPAGTASVPPALNVEVSTLAPFPSTAVTAQKTLSAPSQPCKSPVYRTEPFLAVREDFVIPSSYSLPPGILLLTGGGRIQWGADLPNPLGRISLTGRTAPIARAFTVERLNENNQWETANRVRQGDRLRVLGVLYASGAVNRMEVGIGFVDPNGQPVQGDERGLFLVLKRIGTSSKFELSAYLDRQFQEQAATEVLVCADGEEAPAGVPFLRMQGFGFIVVDEIRIPAGVLPMRFERGGRPMEQESLATGPFRVGPGGCIVPGTGEVVHSAADFDITSRGLDLELRRSWRSGNNYPGTLGWGWSASWDEFAWREGEGEQESILIFTEGGHILRFARNSSGVWQGPSSLYARLDEGAGGLRLLLPHGTEKRFLPVGAGPQAILRLLTVEDRFGNLERWTHASHGRPAYVQDPFARAVQLRFDPETGTVEAFGDWSGRDFEFEVSRSRDADGGVRTLRQARSALIEHAPGEAPVRRRTSFAWNDQNRIRSSNDPAGNGSSLGPLLKFTWYPDGRAETVEERGAGVWSFFPSNNGMRWTDPLGRAKQITLWPHAPTGFARPPAEMEEYLSGRTIKTSFEYNGNGELMRRATPLGGVIEWIYDESAADPRARGNLLSAVRYPVPGLRAEVTVNPVRYDPNAPFTPMAIGEIRTSSTYDPATQLQETFTDAAGRQTTWRIVEGVALSEDLPPVTTPGGVLPRVIKREWNRWGQLLRQIDPNGVITRFSYYPADDPCGQLSTSAVVSHPDKAGGHLAAIVRDAVEPGAVRAVHLAPPRPILERFYYDALGRLLSEQIGTTAATRRVYNAADEVLLTLHPDNGETRVRRDLNGRVKEETLLVADINFPSDIPSVTARFVRRTLDYDNVGRKTEEIVDADGEKLKTKWQYDAAGRLEVEYRPRVFDPINPRPMSTAHHEYDDLDRLVRIIGAKGSPDGEFVQSLEYDDDGNLIDEWHPGPGGSRLGGRTYKWDGFGRQIAATDRDGNRTSFEYDWSGNLTVRRFSGSVAGEAVANPDTAPVLSEERIFLNEAGDAVATLERAFTLQQTPSGWREVPIGTGSRAKIIYRDVQGYEVAQFTDPPTVMATAVFDGHGRKISDSSGLSENCLYGYDDAGRIRDVKVTNSRGTVLFETRRDPTGRPLERLIDQTSVQQWRYDTLGRTRLQMDAYGNPTEFTYDGAGRRIGTVRRLYDGGQRLLQTGAIAPLLSRELMKEEYDAESRLTKTIDSAGAVIEERKFDDRGFVAERTIAEDAFDITAPEPGGGTRRILRDDHSGPSSWTFEWEVDGQPGRITDPDGRWLDLEYDNSRRVKRRIADQPAGVAPRPGSSEQTFLWDALGRLVEATDDNGVTGKFIKFRQTFTSLGGMVEQEHSEDLRPMVARVGSSRINCAYGRNGARLSVVWPWGLTVEYRPDSLGRVQSVYDSTNSEEIVSYIWDAAQVERRTHANGKYGIEMLYDPQGRLKQYKAAKNAAFNDPAQLLDARSYEYEPTGFPLRISDLKAELQNPPGPHPVTVMGYESRGRQAAQVQAERHAAGIVPRAGAFQHYDASGNLAKHLEFDSVVGSPASRVRYQPRPGVTPTRQVQTFVNGANQVGARFRERLGSGLLEDAFRYDRRGNLSKDGVVDYDFDIHGRLVKARSTIDNSVVKIFWDALDRPIRLLINDGTNTSDRRLLWLGTELIGEDENAAKFSFYVRGALNEVVGFERRDGNTRERYHTHTGTDGTLQFLTKFDGTDIVESYTYSPLGVPRRVLGAGVAAASGNRLLWHGHYYLQEFGVALVGSRAYHAELGRFIQPDPAGPLANTIMPGNAYGYGGSNALAYSDDGHAVILVYLGYVAVALLIASFTADLVAPVVGGWGGQLGAAQTIANFGVFHNLAAAFTGEEFYSQAQLSGGDRILRGVGAAATLIGGAGMALKLLKAGSVATQTVARAATVADASDNVANAIGGALRGDPIQATMGAFGISVAAFQRAAGSVKKGFRPAPDAVPRIGGTADHSQEVYAFFRHRTRNFTDVNPTVRHGHYRTTHEIPSPPDSKGNRVFNKTAEGGHAEIVAMFQSFLAGNRGGSGVLVVGPKTLCNACRVDVKKMARILELDELWVFDVARGQYFVLNTPKNFLNVGRGGMRL